jgi:hypothetical protein
MERTVKLVNAVIYQGESRLEAVVVDRHGARRKISVSWLEKDQSDTPPFNWLDIVQGEVEYQLSTEGRVLHMPNPKYLK